MKMKKPTIESVSLKIKHLQEQMRDKTHVSQVGGQDSTKSLQKLTELYAVRRKLLGE